MTERHNPLDTVDIIIQMDGKIVLIRRNKEPFKGSIAIPGGFVEEGETVEQAAVREAEEETGLKVELKEILGVYSDPKRDPRGHDISTVFIADVVGGELESSSDAKEASWIDPEKINLKEVPFDHDKILSDYLKWRKERGTYWSTK